MRACVATVAALWALFSGPVLGQQQFPYTAHINADEVYVRSGPGRNYYPTSKLNTGDRVEVYRHDPGGWCAIRPVEGSFAWVSGRYLEVGDDGLATITGDRVAARVGSDFSDIRDVIQVRLHEGEIVEILDDENLGTGAEADTWYKISPPSGEFRWVYGKYVDRNYLYSGVRKASSDYSPLVERGRRATEHVARNDASNEQAAPAPRRTAHAEDPTRAADVRRLDYWSTTRPSPAAAEAGAEPGPAPAERASAPKPTPRRAERSGRTGRTNKFVEPAREPEGEATLRRLSPEEFQEALREIDMELAVMLAEEPTVWKLDELALRARSLLSEAATAVERGRARLVANKIAQSQDIKRRYDAVAGTRMATQRRNRRLAELSEQRDRAQPEPGATGRFDGDGRLVRVVPARLGVPPYALVDEKNELRCYVTPAPGVKLNYYVGRQIGVNGSRGYLPDGRAGHVTAKNVHLLGATTVR